MINNYTSDIKAKIQRKKIYIFPVSTGFRRLTSGRHLYFGCARAEKKLVNLRSRKVYYVIFKYLTSDHIQGDVFAI